MTMLTRMILALMLGLLILPTFTQDDIAQLRMKADQGNVIAQQQLGYLYSFGQGIPQDYKESTKWLRRQLIKAVPTPNVSWGFHVLRGQGGFLRTMYRLTCDTT